MALAGAAFLALWNDIAPTREPEYDRWHTQEHVPERVAVAGFHGARRYVHRARPVHRYFTLYDVADLAVFTSVEYQDLVDHPTPWSAAMRPDFRNFVRAPCRVTQTSGDGIGAAVALLCFAAAQARDSAAALAAVLALPGVTACHAGERSGGTPPIPWTAPGATAAPLRPFDRMLLIEALDRDAAAAALIHARGALELPALPTDFGNDVYDLAFVFPAHDAAARARHRRARWDA